MTDEDQHDEASQETAPTDANTTISENKTDKPVTAAASDPAAAEDTSSSDPPDAESTGEDSYDFEIPVTPELDAALASERGQPSKPTSPEEKSANEPAADPPQQKLRIIIDVRAPEPATATPAKPPEKPGSPEAGSVRSESTPSKSAPRQDGEEPAAGDSTSSANAPPEQSPDEVEAILNGQPASEPAAADDSVSSTGEPLLPIALPITLRHADRLMLAAFEKLAPEFEQIMRDMTEDCKEEVLWQFTAEMRALNIWR